MFSENDIAELGNAFNRWRAIDRAAPKDDAAALNYIFDVLHMTPEEQDKERTRWIESVERQATRALVDIDEQQAKQKTAQIETAEKIRALKDRFSGNKTLKVIENRDE